MQCGRKAGDTNADGYQDMLIDLLIMMKIIRQKVPLIC